MSRSTLALCGSRRQPPAPRCDARPDGLDHSEGPGAVQESIGRAQSAGTGEGQDEPRAAPFEGIEDQHEADRDKTEESKTIHDRSPGSGRSIQSASPVLTCLAART